MSELPGSELSGIVSKRKPIVLVVDDKPTNVAIQVEVLKCDYDMIGTETGESALELLRCEENPAPLALDIIMPDLDGCEVCRRIKKNSEIRHIPVIIVTAMDQVIDQQRGFDMGAADYITKPYNVSRLLARGNVHIRFKLKSGKLAFFDGLTDIPNRRSLEEALDRELRRAKRSCTELSVLKIDIDHFKLYNDHYGHGAGDECLRRVAHESACAIRWRPMGRFDRVARTDM